MNYSNLLRNCTLCPRKCSIDRFEKAGFCGADSKIKIARASLHMWEEPCISGINGSGTVFFSGCCLKCCFCQNYEISSEGKGFYITEEELADTFIMLQEKGAHNINLVSPTPYVPQIMQALDISGNKLTIPVVYNCGGYENIETLEMLKGKVDIFLPDLKYYESELSQKYSKASDYFEKTSAAIKKMVEISGKPVFDENGIMKSGVIVRHLVLPNCRHDSEKLIEWLGDNFRRDELMVSVMSQFIPVYKAFDFKELSRRTSTFEYNYVADLLAQSGFNGFYQQRSSASKGYIPEFYDYKYY